MGFLSKSFKQAEWISPGNVLECRCAGHMATMYLCTSGMVQLLGTSQTTEFICEVLKVKQDLGTGDG